MTEQNPVYMKHVKAWMLLGLFAFGAFVFSPSYAQAQDGDVDNRLNRLQNEVETLSRAVYRGEMPENPTVYSADTQAGAAMEVRLQQLESEIQSLRGTLEEQNYKIRQLKDTLEKKTGDMELRLNDLEQGGGAPQSLTNISNGATTGDGAVQTFSVGQSAVDNGVTKTITPANTLKAASSGSAATMYENAFALLKNNQFEQAASGFEGFLKAYPDHALANNAKYWLGETHYVRGQYETAARMFAEGYKADPKGTKAADNLLKLGMSLNGAGSPKDACVAFKQLKTEFPTGAAPVLRRAEQEMQRLNCGN